MKLTCKGETIQFEDWTPEESQLGKIRLMLEAGDSAEGIWVWVHPDYRAKYEDDDSEDELIVCALANQSLLGLPWGAYVLAQTRGSNRPECYAKSHDGLEGPASFTLCPNLDYGNTE